MKSYKPKSRFGMKSAGDWRPEGHRNYLNRKRLQRLKDVHNDLGVCEEAEFYYGLHC